MGRNVKYAMNKKYGIVFVALSAAVLLFGFFYIKSLKNQLAKAQRAHTTELLKGNLALGRANTELNDTWKRIREMDAGIQAEVKARNSVVVMYADLKAKYDTKGSGTLKVPVTRFVTVTETGEQVAIKSLPFTFQDFRLNVSGDAVTKKFDYTLTQRFHLKLAETKLPSGGFNHYAELYEVDEAGDKKSKLTLTSFEVTRTDTARPTFSLWNPSVDLLLGGIVYRNFDTSPTGNIGISFMSYGKPGDLSWRFIRPAIGVDKNGLQLSITPAQYNIAGQLPLINNLWLSPNLGYNIDIKSYFLGLGIAVML